MKTAIVILNWNTAGYLEKFLPMLISSVKDVDGTEIIVADNASIDGSVQFVKDNFPEIRTIAFDRNHGFTGGYNRAFQEIAGEGIKDAPEYFLLLNSDIETPEGWLEPLVEWMDKHPDCGACAPKLHSYAARKMFEYAGAAGGFIDSFGYPFCRGRVMKMVKEDCGQYDNCSPEVFWASGACLMVRSEVFGKLGGLDERFFAHMEEIDLCWRMQLAGYRIHVVPQSTVYHIGGGTLPESSPFKLFLNYRNNLLMLDNNLAETFALMHFKSTGDASASAEAGIKEAESIIRIRQLMDGLSAAVYMLTFRFSSSAAVYKAHKEFRKMRKKEDKDRIVGYLESKPEAEITGIYGKWMVFQSLCKGRKIFENIMETDFLKF